MRIHHTLPDKTSTRGDIAYGTGLPMHLLLACIALGRCAIELYFASVV